MINDEQFIKVIDATPLVSIDLIIENNQGQILLGKRTNRPAQNYWFVPGGRIRKNEKIDAAFTRIAATELDLKLAVTDAQLLGAYNHIYKDNYLGKQGINTHYVVLAYKIFYEGHLTVQADEQHSELQWLSVHELLDNTDVHANTKAYFINT